MQSHPKSFSLSKGANAAALILAAAAWMGWAQLGEEGTPMLPGLPYRVHDASRPHPRVITPGTESTQERPGRPPSDAIVLFDGKDLSKWVNRRRGQVSEAKWKVENGYMEVVAGTGDLLTKEKFGTGQYHIEWASPTVITGSSQGRGNSGVLIMERYEIQVLDCYKNPTYADGHAGAIYGQWPPLVNACREPGQWQTYDIIFEAPVFDGDKVVKPVYFTVLHNGVVIHNHQAAMGPMVFRQVARYKPHEPLASLMLQDHNNPVRYRNIWYRPLGEYDKP
ncbi:MAG: 3-keto-disaccharide hydrolase [Bryobacteraceae bacterium]